MFQKIHLHIEIIQSKEESDWKFKIFEDRYKPDMSSADIVITPSTPKRFFQKFLNFLDPEYQPTQRLISIQNIEKLIQKNKFTWQEQNCALYTVYIGDGDIPIQEYQNILKHLQDPKYFEFYDHRPPRSLDNLVTMLKRKMSEPYSIEIFQKLTISEKIDFLICEISEFFKMLEDYNLKEDSVQNIAVYQIAKNYFMRYQPWFGEEDSLSNDVTKRILYQQNGNSIKNLLKYFEALQKQLNIPLDDRLPELSLQ